MKYLILILSIIGSILIFLSIFLFILMFLYNQYELNYTLVGAFKNAIFLSGIIFSSGISILIVSSFLIFLFFIRIEKKENIYQKYY